MSKIILISLFMLFVTVKSINETTINISPDTTITYSASYSTSDVKVPDQISVTIKTKLMGYIVFGFGISRKTSQDMIIGNTGSSACTVGDFSGYGNDKTPVED